MKRIHWVLSGFLIAILCFLLQGSLLRDQEEAELARVHWEIARQGFNWRAGKTSVSSYTWEERRQYLYGLREGQEVELQVSKQGGAVYSKSYPENLDWRNSDGVNWMTPVRHQGQCGSCWAFASVGAVEALFRIALRDPAMPLDYSEQYLVSCSGAGSCASGGWPVEALAFIQKNGIPPESCFPYVAEDVPCNPCDDWQSDGLKIRSINVLVNTPETLMEALLDGPLVVSMDVFSDFRFYTGGIYQKTSDATYEAGHAIVMVGYNSASDYWICKNSWGSGWGDAGYFMIKRGDSNIGRSAIRVVVNMKKGQGE